MPQVIYSRPTLDEAIIEGAGHNVALGRFLTAWSEVEGAYASVFIHLAGIRIQDMSLFLDKIKTRDLLDLITDMVEQHPESEIRDELQPAIDAASNLSKKRNQIVHAGWGRLDGEMARFYHGLTSDTLLEVMQDTQKGRDKFRRWIYTVPEIDALTKEALIVRDRIMVVTRSLMRRFLEQPDTVGDLRREISNLRRELDMLRYAQHRASEA